jgi:hypothetical protein
MCAVQNLIHAYVDTLGYSSHKGRLARLSLLRLLHCLLPYQYQQCNMTSRSKNLIFSRTSVLFGISIIHRRVLAWVCIHACSRGWKVMTESIVRWFVVREKHYSLAEKVRLIKQTNMIDRLFVLAIRKKEERERLNLLPCFNLTIDWERSVLYSRMDRMKRGEYEPRLQDAQTKGRKDNWTHQFGLLLRATRWVVHGCLFASSAIARCALGLCWV